MLRSSILRASKLAVAPTSTNTALARNVPAIATAMQSRNNGSYAVSNVTLTDLEKRWETMAPNEQAELWMQLRDRMKGSWAELTLQEKKASYYIAFGAHGPRAAPPPGEGMKVFTYTMIGVFVSFATFWTIRQGGRPAPKTMTKEWQEASNEYLKEQKSEPITGFASENYKGPGMVQN
ncbi:mitochondrial cytochrome c oxidase-like protein subunit V [Geopyxis carbonaria]|nr:mitochondrial cytochrome c oxidase-like protein subunit V [Geopyxis carbonaria]